MREKRRKAKERRSGDERRSEEDRRAQAAEEVGNERRAGVDRRTGTDRRQNRGIDPYARLQVAIVLGGLLAIPAIRTWMDGSIAVDTAAIRVAVAMVFAVIAVNGLNALLVMYQTKPDGDDAQHDGIEDAVVLDRSSLDEGAA
jgi:Flp pilus assembly protein TadB